MAACLALALLVLLPSPGGAASGRLLPVVAWDSADFQQLQQVAAASSVQCGARCLRAAACAGISFSSGGACGLLGCPAGSTLTAGVCEPDCPAGTVQQADGSCLVQCATGWTSFGTACYKRVTATYAWGPAETHCASLLAGAHLASVHSAEEENFIWNTMTNNGLTAINYHVGFKHRGTDAAYVFHWTDGTAVGYTNWRSGQPNFNQAVDLGVSMYSDGAWCDVDHDGTTYVFQSMCKFAPTGK